MKRDEKILALAQDFRTWGRRRARRVLAGVRKWGTQFLSFVTEKDC